MILKPHKHEVEPVFRDADFEKQLRTALALDVPTAHAYWATIRSLLIALLSNNRRVNITGLGRIEYKFRAGRKAVCTFNGQVRDQKDSISPILLPSNLLRGQMVKNLRTPRGAPILKHYRDAYQRQVKSGFYGKTV